MGNQNGKERGPYSKYVDWENAEPPSPPGKPYLAPDGADLPDVIKIRWAKPMYDGGAPILGYVVEHRRTGSPHWLRASPHLAPDTELVLTGLEPGWRFQFRVSAENAVGRSEPGQLSEPLTVTLHKSAASAPHFNRELRDTVALENETVEFIVHVIATPAPKISWYKDGFELFSSRRTKIVTEDETSTLIIYQAAPEDEGEIKCTATNRAGHIVTKATLKLEAPPRIRLPRQYEDGLLFEKGETMRLKVTTAGRPPPSVMWYHNGERVQTGGRYEVADIERGSSLRISDACRQDRGEYMVQGTNKIGADAVSFLITITDRPSAPGRPQVAMTIGKTVTLRWSSPDDDGGCKIGAYIVEYFRAGWDMWLKASTSRQLTTVLSDLIEGSEYKFRVKAENPYGTSEASEESESVFIPDPKRGILKPDVKSTPMAVDPLWQEDRSVKVPDVDSRNKRQASPSPEDEPETEAAKRRRLLEENARKLLDTPLTVLLAEKAATHTIEKPPRKLKDNRSPSKSPIPIEGLQESHPPIPKRRNKTRSIEDAPPITITPPPIEHPQPSYQGLLRDDSITHGSSELMLVLLPDDRRTKSGELSASHRSEVELSLAEPGTAPPLSLSAPELGSEEPIEFPPMRDAVSSSELLYVRAMARIYEDAEEDESQTKRSSLERRPSLRETSGLVRKSSFRESALERRHSFKETVSEAAASNIPSKSPLLARKPPNALPSSQESKIPVLQVKPETSGQPIKSILRKDDRLGSVEREQLEFARVRERLRQKNETVPVEMPQRPPNLKQQSSMSSQLSSYEGETGSELYDEDEEMSVEEEEELEEEDEGEYEEDEEEEAVEEEIEDLDLAKFESQFRKEEILPEKPPAVPKHNIPSKESIQSILKKEAPKATEEETYHPRSMIPTRSILRAIPAIVEEEPVNELQEITVDLAPEIQTPIIEMSPTQPEAVSDTPAPNIPPDPPIKKKSKILNKIGFGLKKGKKKPVVTTLAEDAVLPAASVALPKPILKKKTSLKKKEKGKDKSAKSEGDSPPEIVIEEPKKKQVRISEPGENVSGLTVPKSTDPKLSPLSQARNQRLQRRQQSLEEEEEANKVLINHYSDIVREFGLPKKAPAKLYLEFEELEAHATDPIEVEVDEVSAVASDLEERGSAPDMSVLDQDTANNSLNASLEELPVVVEREVSVPPEPEEVKETSPARTNSPSPTPSPSPFSMLTPEERIRSSVDYLTDVCIFLFACWLYLFKNELYVIPVLVLLVYRQIKDSVQEKYNKLYGAVLGKIPNRFLKRKTSEDESVNMTNEADGS